MAWEAKIVELLQESQARELEYQARSLVAQQEMLALLRQLGDKKD